MLHRDLAFHKERGASYVNVIWLIVFVILLLAAVVVAWTQASKVTSLEKEIATLEIDKKKFETRSDEADNKLKEFSAITGYQKDGFANPDAAKADLDEVKKALGKDSPAGGTLQEYLAATIKLYQQRGAAVSQRDNDLQLKDQQIASKTTEAASVRTDLQRQIDELNTRARDQQTSDAARIQNLEGQLQQKEAAATEANTKLTAANAKFDETVAEWNKKYNLVEAKNGDLNTKLAFLRAPATPKGTIVEVSEKLPIGYIDLGERERVVGGMRFEVCDYDNQRKLRSKGWVEVTAVEGNMSHVRLEAADKNSPITRGDLLLNPLFDPRGDRKAALVGRFPLSAGGKKGIEQKLNDLGIKVTPTVDATTDYLIVGDAEFSNTGEKQDIEADPLVLASTKFGTLRYSLKELEGFFRR